MKARISINGKRFEKYFESKEEAEAWRNNLIEENSSKSLAGEQWLTIPNFSRYEASNLGRIRSLNYKNSGVIKILTPAISKDGYLKTMLLSDNGKYYSWMVHKFITQAFFGIIGKGLEINHKDGIKQNNNIANLEYCTHSDNCQHACDTGLWTPLRGELNGMAKLTNDQVLMIKEQKQKGGRYWGRNELALKLGVSAKHLQDIANG